MKNPQDGSFGALENETDRGIESSVEPYRTPSDVSAQAPDAISTRRRRRNWIMLIGGIGLLFGLGFTAFAVSIVSFGFNRSGPPQKTNNLDRARSTIQSQLESAEDADSIRVEQQGSESLLEENTAAENP
jgi:hypothetical protein